MTMFLMITFFALQSLLCFRIGNRLWKLLPLLLGLLMEAGSWAVVFLVPNPDPGTASLVMTMVLSGIAVLSGVTLAWFVYGAISAVKKLIRQ